MINATKEYDVVFLSYKEENKETHWNRLKSIVPKAKRVDGVKGFDAAHRAVGEASSTDRTIVIDGDNWLNDDIVYDLIFRRAAVERDCVVSYASINAINSLIYGNGGVKIWPTELLRNSSSHEFAKFAQNVDFVYNTDIIYLQQNKIISSTVQNATECQAFAAGFREGVKLSMRLEELKKPMVKFFLNTWCSVGADAKHGLWAMYGARLGIYNSLYNPGYDVTLINDLDYLYELCQSYETIDNLTAHVDEVIDYNDLRETYGISAVTIPGKKSETVKWLTKRIPRTFREDKVW
jgi:hypothetical protein